MLDEAAAENLNQRRAPGDLAGLVAAGDVLPLLVVRAREMEVDGRIFPPGDATPFVVNVAWSGGSATPGCWSWPERV